MRAVNYRVLLPAATFVLCGVTTPLHAQTDALTTRFSEPTGAQAPATPADQPPPSPQKVAAAEENAKPQRGFFGTLVHNLGDDVKHIPRRNSLYWLAAGSAATAAIHPADDYINEHLRGSGFAETFFKPGKYIGSFPVIFGASITTYLVGRHRHIGWVQHFGMDLIEATLLSEGITQGIKAAVRRDRPLHEDGTRNTGFSFPSGHASVTFAAATVFQQHFGWKAAVPTYLVASYVAMSRLHDERHFASDVMAGATEGIIIGRSVTWHGRNFYASPLLGPKAAGVMVSIDTAPRH